MLLEAREEKKSMSPDLPDYLYIHRATKCMHAPRAFPFSVPEQAARPACMLQLMATTPLLLEGAEGPSGSGYILYVPRYLVHTKVLQYLTARSSWPRASKFHMTTTNKVVCRHPFTWTLKSWP